MVEQATPNPDMFLAVPDGRNVSHNESGEGTSRSAHIAEMNLIYADEELKEALETTNQLIEGVRERKDAMFRELAQNMCSIPIAAE